MEKPIYELKWNDNGIEYADKVEGISALQKRMKFMLYCGLIVRVEQKTQKHPDVQ